MKRRTLGKTQVTLPPIGLGCMGLSEFYGPPTEQRAAIELLHQAIELGVQHFDTAEIYGIGANESLLGEAFRFSLPPSSGRFAILIPVHLPGSTARARIAAVR